MTMTVDELCERLKAICPHPLIVKIHENRSSYARSKREKNGTIQLSIHRLFLFSSTPVLQALIRFALRRDLQARAVIRQMAYIYFTQIAPPTPDSSFSHPQGTFFNLQEIYDRVNQTFFDEKVNVPITWFPLPRYSRFRRITFGSFDRTRPLIKINRLLDCSEVPLSIVEFIVYHEMLHSVCATVVDRRGRLRVHTAEFRQKEALHPYFAIAKEWEKNSINFFKGKYGRT